ncbi:hypothetical protein Tco_0716014 [Tanacetum coccineum]
MTEPISLTMSRGMMVSIWRSSTVKLRSSSQALLMFIEQSHDEQFNDVPHLDLPKSIRTEIPSERDPIGRRVTSEEQNPEHERYLLFFMARIFPHNYRIMFVANDVPRSMFLAIDVSGTDMAAEASDAMLYIKRIRKDIFHYFGFITKEWPTRENIKDDDGTTTQIRYVGVDIVPHNMGDHQRRDAKSTPFTYLSDLQY